MSEGTHKYAVGTIVILPSNRKSGKQSIIVEHARHTRDHQPLYYVCSLKNGKRYGACHLKSESDLTVANAVSCVLGNIQQEHHKNQQGINKCKMIKAGTSLQPSPIPLFCNW